MARTYKRDSRGRFKGAGGGGAKARAGSFGKKVVKVAKHPATKAIAVTALSVAADVAIKHYVSNELSKIAATSLKNKGLKNTQKALKEAPMRAKANRRGTVKVTTLSGKKFAR